VTFTKAPTIGKREKHWGSNSHQKRLGNRVEKISRKKLLGGIARDEKEGLLSKGVANRVPTRATDLTVYQRAKRNAFLNEKESTNGDWRSEVEFTAAKIGEVSRSLII